MALTIKTGVENLSFCRIGRAGVISYWDPRPGAGCKYEHGRKYAHELMREMSANEHEMLGDPLKEIVKCMRNTGFSKIESAFLAEILEYAVAGYRQKWGPAEV